MSIIINSSSQVFLVATKRISQNKIPLVHDVIPIFDILMHTLNKFINDESCLPAIRAAALRGFSVLNKYYALTDDSIVY